MRIGQCEKIPVERDQVRSMTRNRQGQEFCVLWVPLKFELRSHRIEVFSKIDEFPEGRLNHNCCQGAMPIHYPGIEKNGSIFVNNRADRSESEWVLTK
jgi:hypothetical protein